MKNAVVEIYNDLLLSIKQGNGVNGKSIAKPILILSIIEAVSKSELQHNRILWNEEVLKKSYNDYMEKYDLHNMSPIIVPYYHLASSEFYHLVWKSESRPPIKGHTPSGKYLREHLLYAKLDDELWDLLQDADSRNYLKQNIINRYLTK